MNGCKICAKIKQINSKEDGCQNLANSWALYNGAVPKVWGSPKYF